ncbi:MAG: MFS transporter [Candidatus Eremiobacteraeota bacterium]|nr:MFS transporter [Candidatus Eremiobacteraeota bacterium]
MVRRLIPILGITFIDILGFSILIPTLPYLALHFNASAFTIGVIFSTFSACQLIAGPLWGSISDRIGRKAVLIISQIGATIGWAMLAFAPNIMWVFIARMVEGASGGNIGVTQAYVADLVEPKQRARAFGYIGAAFGAGMVFGPVFGGLLYQHYGFQVTFLAASALQLVTLIVTIFGLPESRTAPEEAVPGFSEIITSFRIPRLSRILWQKLALSLGLYAWFGVFSLFLARQMHFGLAETDYYFSAFAILNVIMNIFIVGRVSDRVGERALSNLGLGSLVLAFAFVPFVNSIPTLGISLSLFSLGMAFSNSGITALISNAATNATQGTVLGVSSALDSFAGMVSPPLSTYALGRYGSPYSSVVSGVMAAIALLMGLAAAPKDKDYKNDDASPLDALLASPLRTEEQLAEG